MLIDRLTVRMALGLTVLAAAACGDDNSNFDDDDGKPADSSTPTVVGDGGRDAGPDIDAARRDAAQDDSSVGDASDDGGSTTDAAMLDIDAAPSTPDAATPDATTNDGAAADAARDASTDAGDAARGDGGDAGDAGRDAGPDAGACDINDVRFGCGVEVSDDWVHFAGATFELDVDRKYGRAWSHVGELVTPESLRTYCQQLSIGTITNFEVPQVDDIRTLGAGCAATLPGGSCQVEAGQVPESAGAACVCNTGVGPNDGKFCRPEVGECTTLWTATVCGPDEPGCTAQRTWVYDVRTGSLGLATQGQGIAEGAKARCVAGFTL